jgi:hypothetical protein
MEYESLDDLLAAAQGCPDAILGALLTEVSKGNQLAGRVILQALLGRIVRMATRDPWAGVDDYVAALWCRIQTYPFTSRPTRIAANLSMDTLKTVYDERRWLREGEVPSWPPEAFCDERPSGGRRRAVEVPWRDRGQSAAPLPFRAGMASCPVHLSST